MGKCTTQYNATSWIIRKQISSVLLNVSLKWHLVDGGKLLLNDWFSGSNNVWILHLKINIIQSIYLTVENGDSNGCYSRLETRVKPSHLCLDRFQSSFEGGWMNRGGLFKTSRCTARPVTSWTVLKTETRQLIRELVFIN
jgi:hypothetical protein